MSKEVYKKLIVVFLVLFMFGFVLEGVTGINNIPVLSSLIALGLSIFLICKMKNIYAFKVVDGLIFIFLTYLIWLSLINNNFNITILVIVGAIFPYFIARTIVWNGELEKIMLYTINIIAWIVIINLVILFLQNDGGTRVGIENTNHIAVGEMLGMFSIANLYGGRGNKIKSVNIFNYIIGIISCLILINARGAVLSIIIVTLFITVLNSRDKLKWIVYISLIICAYLFFIREGSFIVKTFPGVERFAWNNIINDPTMIGSTHYNEGRLQLYIRSFEIFLNNPIIGGGLMSVYSHNIFLETLSTVGIIGFFILVPTIFIVVNYSIKLLKNNNVIAALFIFSLVYRQSSFAFNSHKSLFIFMGLVVSYYYVKGKNVLEAIY